ncbi:hypothetical protein ACIBSW_31825 [Actinoplanes sp. NPDC049668]|uniref:hypothetical protein n=1 Tax=unclassified Actinoplanes TaxID=2626549 RepID=UPI0033A88EC8
MLEGLDGVAWAGLEHAYGSAADVPDLIRALRDTDPAARQNARRGLYGNIFHQGTRYEASAHAVPFLIELLADPGTRERNELLSLLTSLAIGYDESWLPDPFPVASYRRRALADVELRVYDAVRSGVPLYCALLVDEEPAVRLAAAYALGWFGEDAVAVTGPLVAAVGDRRAATGATALVALGLVGAAERVVRAALTDDRELVRWGAAVAHARLRGPAADPAAVTELLSWAGGDRPSEREIPYLDGDLSGLAGLALRQVGDAHAEAAFDALLARIPAVSGPESLPVVGEALRRAFPDGRLAQGARFADLDARQRRLVRALADSPGTWGWGRAPVFGNFMGLVLSYGLPFNPETMRTFVAEP